MIVGHVLLRGEVSGGSEGEDEVGNTGDKGVGYHSVLHEHNREHFHRPHNKPVAGYHKQPLDKLTKRIKVTYEELILLKQGLMSVNQNTDKFYELIVRSQVVESDHQAIARYRSGLRSDIQRELMKQRLMSIEEMYQVSLRIKAQGG
ncbi:unnamed protein product [Fraxinus pennsylvanica]|uniref:Uncharacterized protein n=1 Tax=Fraxinus pennsylvanica TaxID=56036 RepID=A0AAD1YV58_9LAMI|nr:unnamed protein product [Fraxinus pennsylvanica]